LRPSASDTSGGVGSITVSEDPTPAAMRAAATLLLAVLSDAARDRAAFPFDDPRRRRIEYRPRPQDGVSLADLDPAARKAAHRLLATALSPHAYAQAMAIVALEEVLDRAEGWRRGRHSNDYSVVVFGTPDGDGPWAWRFEGHHLSVTMTLDGDRVSPTPVFFGANPARVRFAGHDVLRPLGPEEDLARALLAALDPRSRAEAIVADHAPSDLRSGPRADVDGQFHPLGVAGARMGPTARALLWQVVAAYLDRLPADLAAAEAAALDVRELHFAWEGPVTPGAGHYYRIQAPSLLVEYDNQANDANHAHTVLRRPGADFGDVLAAHRARAR
jgi:hypothetical protein